VREPGLHREGLGLPAVGLIEPGGPNAPRAGFRVPLTVLALPGEGGPGGLKSALVDPDRVDRVRTAWGKVPVAMDLDAAYSATASTGPRLGSGLANLLRPGLFGGRPRIVFLQPFDPDKTPVVLVHGLLSTPRMWEPLVRALLADPWVREHTQLWFFYYPTGQPVPLSALQLREALDEAVRVHKPRKPMILIGHSMGGILSRAQVSGIDLETARTMVPEIDRLSKGSLVRRALVFEPRTDVSRAVFMFTPHRGSRLANSSLAAWGIRLIRLPSTLLDEVSAVADYVAGIDGESLPTSIQGLSPESGFLRVLDGTRPSVPVHTVLGDRGRGDGAAGSDGVVPYLSATLPGAQSQLVVPTGHGGFAHPKAVEDLKRILKLSIEDPKPAARR
jgi:pimeloyl-ACP methyl ester carboxylesterase